MKFDDLYKILEDDLLPKADDGNDLMPQDLSDKHGISIEDIEIQIQTGIERELSDTDDKDLAMSIVMDHLSKDPKYYTHPDKTEETNAK